LDLPIGPNAKKENYNNRAIGPIIMSKNPLQIELIVRTIDKTTIY